MLYLKDPGACFHFDSDYILENEAIQLRPLQYADWENLLEISLNEPELWKYSLTQGGGEQNLKHYIASALEARDKGKEYPFIVFDKRQNLYAGCTRFYDIQLSYKTLQLGYTWYGKDFQGTGLNKHCKFLLLRFAFEYMQMERVEFRADSNNQRSIAAMKSLGCTVEGVLRSHLPTIEGGRRDSVVLSILRHEWTERIKENLKQKLF